MEEGGGLVLLSCGRKSDFALCLPKFASSCATFSHKVFRVKFSAVRFRAPEWSDISVSHWVQCKVEHSESFEAQKKNGTGRFGWDRVGVGRSLAPPTNKPDLLPNLRACGQCGRQLSSFFAGRGIRPPPFKKPSKGGGQDVSKIKIKRLKPGKKVSASRSLLSKFGSGVRGSCHTESVTVCVFVA